MPKSSVFSPNENLYQIITLDFKRRGNDIYTPQFGDEPIEQSDIPTHTLFRKGKSPDQAKAKVPRRFGSIIACFKVDSHERKLRATESLNLHQEQIEVAIAEEEFVVGEDLEIQRDNIEIEAGKLDFNEPLDK
jgi:hypothetical protein